MDDLLLFLFLMGVFPALTRKLSNKGLVETARLIKMNSIPKKLTGFSMQLDTSKRGFASMDEEKRKRIASMGGKASKGNFANNPQRASIAGRKGGLNSHRKKTLIQQEEKTDTEKTDEQKTIENL